MNRRAVERSCTKGETPRGGWAGVEEKGSARRGRALCVCVCVCVFGVGAFRESVLVVFFVQKLRAPELSRLLVTKQKCERNCVALLSVSSLLFLFHVILYACMFLCVPTIQVASLLGKIVLAQEFKL